MHELSIARSLVRVAEEATLELPDAVRVTRLYLRLGPLAGVVREALEFAYGFAAEGTVLEGSELVIEAVPLTVRCDACSQEGPPKGLRELRCTACDAPTPLILTGRELEVRAIDYDDPPADPTSTSTRSAAPKRPQAASPISPTAT